ncbi:thioredoxin domain-containing protein [Actinomadura graeca]|uniref:Thioredoxin domain-containing protein n=1 Tax=Actinomadura graeca TaxID=2750812 RepID=A0ABX8R598_9ACTN|nr:thioredoxin domain-containing protein [Actinomadura graeca]QXJ25449.1 thioredoxin domain-containing protein [Actinomadura graeca]
MSKAEGKESARHRLADGGARAAARGRRRRALVVVAGTVAVAAAAVAAVVIVVGGREGTAIGDYEGALAPAVRQSDGSIAMAQPGVTGPVLELYEDFQCPACLALEERQGGTLKELAAQGKAKVVYRPFQLFQQDPLMSNSRRAANAAACAPADRWVEYHDTLYAHQPDEGDTGFTNPELITWAGESGITGADFADCVNGAERMETVEQVTAHAGKAGVNSTPYLALDGRKAGDDVLGSPDALREAVAEAGTGAPDSRGGSATGTAVTR